MQINVALCVSESNLLSLIWIFFNKSEEIHEEDAVTSARGFTSSAEENFLCVKLKVIHCKEASVLNVFSLFWIFFNKSEKMFDEDAVTSA